MIPTLANAKSGNSIYYIGVTDGTIDGWDFFNIWTLDPSKNNGYPILAQTPISITSTPVSDAVEGSAWSHTPSTNPSGTTVSVSGASWLASDGTTISGTVPAPLNGISETFNVTITASKINHISATQSFTLTVYAELTFATLPTAGLVITPISGMTFLFDLSGSADFSNLYLDLGDGTIVDNVLSYTHTYTTYGDFNVVVTATNNMGAVTNSETISLEEPPEEFTVTFVIYGSDTFTETVIGGNTVTIPADPDRAGYDFIGWYTASKVPFNFSAPIISNLFLYAKWDPIIGEPEEFTVTFYVYDTVTFAITIEDGMPVTKPADPVRAGYVFKYWLTSANEPFNFTAPITSDIDLHAEWELAEEVGNGGKTGRLLTILAAIVLSVGCVAGVFLGLRHKVELGTIVVALAALAALLIHKGMVF
jgi:uncharacterized repeat protein (TIGR02543 family)